jgi:mono/diheme cytochrome c family protein
LPFVFKAVIAVSVVVTWIPLALIARARYSYSEEPRVQLMQDMGSQPKYREQQSSEVFLDNRADRPPIVGTVPHGFVQDDHFYNGYTRDEAGKVTFFDTFPDRLRADKDKKDAPKDAPIVTEQLVARGQERFNIYCTPCHGYDGSGHGVVNDRALALSLESETDSLGALHPKAKWVQAADLRSELVRSRPVGHIYNTINVGIRNMGGYGPQIPAADRWAIVAYVRALQLGQNPTPEMIKAPPK